VKIALVTSNEHKAREVAAFFAGVMDITHIPLDCPEYRDDDIGEIARKKAHYAYEKLGIPLIADDTAFAIPALNGFPGPYAAYVHRTIGNDGILRLMDGKSDRTAWFETAIAFAYPDGIMIFRGLLSGTLVPARGTGGFGYDPIFEYQGRTLAEYPLIEKSGISHRARALSAFRDWILHEQLDGKPPW
jgi:XTP/dITP diphosphohydrolase